MHTIKKIAGLVILLPLSLHPVNAQIQKYGFSISPLAGMLYGQGEEILYKYPGRDQYVSQLLWDLKPLVYTGFALDFGPRDPFGSHGFVAAASVRFGLPLKTGIIEDRDWTNDTEDFLTNYSRHDAYSLNAITADVSAGFSWRITDFLSLRAYGEFLYMLFSWAAEDGYLQYPKDNLGDYLDDEPWNDGLEKDYLNGAGIQYRQNWFIVSPGISLKGRISDFFSVEGNINYSPFIYIVARDDHLYPNLFPASYNGMLFWDVLSFGHYVKGGAAFIITPRENLAFSLSLSYKHISGARGNSYTEDTGEGVSGIAFPSVYDGGAGFSALDISFAVKIRAAGRD